MNVSTDRGLSLILDIFDSLGMSVFVLDGDRRIAALNSTAKASFSYTLQELADKDINTIIGNLDAKSSSKIGATFEGICTRKNSETFIANISFLHDYNDARTIVVIQDISTQRKVEQKAQQRAKELAAFNALAKTLSQSMEIDKIMQDTMGMLLSVMDIDASWIYLVDEETGELYLHSFKGLNGDFFRDVGRLESNECFSGKVASSGRPLVVKKATEDPRITKMRVKEHGIESIAGVPISSKGSVLGVLGAASMKASHFTSMDMHLLMTIGNQIGVAIENARLFEKLRDKMEQIRLINEVSSVINSSLSIGTVFRLMASEIKRIIDYDRASINLLDEKANSLLIFALNTNMSTRLIRGVKSPIKGTSAGWVAENNKPWINYDLKENIAFHLDKRLLDEGIRSTISIPLYQDKVLGAFNLDSTSPRRYSEKDLEILIPVAKHIAIALENAMLFEEISKEKKEWEKTFDAITDMVWIQDAAQNIIRTNQEVLRRTGLSYKDIIGKKCQDIFKRLKVNTGQCPCINTDANRRSSFAQLIDNSGNIFYFWTYPLIDEEGKLYAMVHYGKDVTEQKKLEQQLLRTDKLASLGTLISGIAHEINNPMGIIAGYSEALLDRAKDEKLRCIEMFEDFPEYLETINKEIFRCKKILNSLLDFSRPSGGTRREIDINEILKEVILLVNHKAASHSHSIILNLDRELPDIKAEPGHLRQLFMNIIMNSMYFMAEGGKIDITTALSGAGSYIEITISDTGCGILDENLNKIFDPFFTTKPVGEGTGLGLAICHRIVQDHNGIIEAESEVGKGTTFKIRLPVEVIHE